MKMESKTLCGKNRDSVTVRATLPVKGAGIPGRMFRKDSEITGSYNLVVKTPFGKFLLPSVAFWLVWI